MTALTQIGNSQGIRIPKALIKQAKLENTSISLEVVKEGLLLKPVHQGREGWSENIAHTLLKHKGESDEAFLNDFLDGSDLEEFEW